MLPDGPSNVNSRLANIHVAACMGCPSSMSPNQACMSHSDRDSILSPAGTSPKSTLSRLLQLVLVLGLWEVRNFHTMGRPHLTVELHLKAHLPTLSFSSSLVCKHIPQRFLLVLNATTPLSCTLFIRSIARMAVFGSYSVAHPLQS